MKPLGRFLLAVLLASLAWAPPVVAFRTVSLLVSAAQSNGATPAIDTSSATLLVVMCGGWPSTPTLTDSKSNTWTGLTDQTRNSYHGRLFYVTSPTVGSNHTFTCGPSFPGTVVAAFSGTVTVSPFDQENGATSGTTPISTGSVTPSENNELVIAGVSFEPTSVSSINGGFSIIDTAPNAGGVGASMAYLVQTTAGAANPAWTMAGNADLMAVIATFKSVPPTTVPVPGIIGGPPRRVVKEQGPMK